MKPLITFTIASLILTAVSSQAATLVSNAMDATNANAVGTVFGTAGITTNAVAGVTTTIVTALGGTVDNATGPVRMRAVSAANGMDLTYDVSLSAFSFTTVDVAETIRTAGGILSVNSTNGNPEKGQTTPNEYFLLSVSNVINSGATTYNLDGFIQLQMNLTSGVQVWETYTGGVGTNLLTSSFGTPIGTGSPIGSSGNLRDGNNTLTFAATSSLALLAASDDPSQNLDNRLSGFSVQFTSIPEPSAALLGGLGVLSLLLLRRR